MKRAAAVSGLPSTIIGTFEVAVMNITRVGQAQLSDGAMLPTAVERP
jgi:hypothetical protein